MTTTLANGRTEAPTNPDGSLNMENDWTPPPNFPSTVIAIHAISPEGFPIVLTLNDPAQGAMSKWVTLLQRQGYTAPANPTPAGAGPAQSATPAGSVPTCPYHGPMKESTIKGKEGTYYCSKKMADGSYCKEKG